MTQNKKAKEEARNYMEEHPGTSYTRAKRIVDAQHEASKEEKDSE